MRASRFGVAPIQIQRKLQYAWLAPDLIEGLLEGQASSRLSLASVCSHFTMDWAAQRRLCAQSPKSRKAARRRSEPQKRATEKPLAGRS